MANTATPRGSRFRGVFFDGVNNRAALHYNSTEVVDWDADDWDVKRAQAIDNGLTIDCGGLTITAGGLTVTAGGATITAGGLTVTAGGLAVDAGDFSVDGDCVTGLFLVDTSEDNIKIGGTAAHATTPGTQSISLFAGTAPNGTLCNGATLFAGCDTCVIEIRAEDSGGTATTL